MRRLLKRALAAAALLLAALSAFTLIDAWEAFGGAPTGARLERMVASPQWSDGIFVNPQPTWNDYLGMFTTMGAMSPVADPEGPLPVQTGDRSRFASPPETGLRPPPSRPQPAWMCGVITSSSSLRSASPTRSAPWSCRPSRSKRARYASGRPVPSRSTSSIR